ncbi:hypothetical protein CYMTET_21635 [Cymbomonas tetramitiformis]|uniref:Uncharacterized protein n=1 Tax=Cymbomonas tetramitiformis TaxID=36881 RepID=A0AAE0L2Z9_9CHLO|nr:hypothetical protein CYMTET_21635 [Cymbomonas tetramitiformis]
MAEAGAVDAGSVVITGIISGSVVVTSEVTFDEDGDADAFATTLQDDAATVFTYESFADYGTPAATGVSTGASVVVASPPRSSPPPPFPPPPFPPSSAPTAAPTAPPTGAPTAAPTAPPTGAPTVTSTAAPTASPITAAPTGVTEAEEGGSSSSSGSDSDVIIIVSVVLSFVCVSAAVGGYVYYRMFMQGQSDEMEDPDMSFNPTYTAPEDHLRSQATDSLTKRFSPTGAHEVNIDGDTEDEDDSDNEDANDEDSELGGPTKYQSMSSTATRGQALLQAAAAATEPSAARQSSPKAAAEEGSGSDFDSEDDSDQEMEQGHPVKSPTAADPQSPAKMPTRAEALLQSGQEQTAPRSPSNGAIQHTRIEEEDEEESSEYESDD